MKILIIRHGEPDYSIDSLTKKGFREADILSERLTKLDIQDFYCSPLGRAKDTAKPTLEKFGKKAKILPWLEEWRGYVCAPHGKRQRIAVWDWEAQEYGANELFFDRNNWTKEPIIATGKSEEIFEETKVGLDSLLESYGYKREGFYFRCENNRDITIALFCHFGLGSALIGYMAGIAPPVLWNSFFMPPSSVTTLVSSEIEKGIVTFRCMQMGDTSHLYAAGEPISKSGLKPEIYDECFDENVD